MDVLGPVFGIPRDPLDLELVEQLDVIDPQAYYGQRVNRDLIADLDEGMELLQDVSISTVPGLSQEANFKMLVKVAQILRLGVDLRDHRVSVLESALAEERVMTERRNERLEGLQREVDGLREQQALGQGGGAGVSDLMQRAEELQKGLTRAEEDRDRALEAKVSLEGRLKESDESLKQAREQLDTLDSQYRLLKEETRAMTERAELDAMRKRDQTSRGAQKSVEEELKQRTYEVKKLLRDNQDLDQANQDLLRKQMRHEEELREVSKTMLRLAEAESSWKGREEDMSGKMRDAEIKLEAADEENADLRDQVNAMTLYLEQVKVQLARNEKMWEAERQALRQQVDALQAARAVPGAPVPGDASHPPRGPRRMNKSDTSSSQGDSTLLDNVEALQEALREAQSQVLFFMEAYEALERNLGVEIDKALASERQAYQESRVRSKVLEEELRKERERAGQAMGQLEGMQRALRDAEERNQLYEKGFGLTEAVQEIKSWKKEGERKDKAIKELIEKVNRYSDKLEQLFVENRALREKAGVPESEAVQLGDIKLRHATEVNQLRSLVDHLEWELQQREETEARLRNELRYRVKWAGREAAKLGLSEYQVALVEETIESMKSHGYGGTPERKVMDRMEARIRFLEQRLRQFERMDSVPEAYRALIPFIVEEGSEAHLGAGPLAGEAGMGWAERAFTARYLDDLKASLASLAQDMARTLETAAGSSGGGDFFGRQQLADHVQALLAMAAATRDRYHQAQKGAGFTGPAGAAGGDPVSLGLEGLHRILREQAAQLGDVRAMLVEKEALSIQLAQERDTLAAQLQLAVMGGGGAGGGGGALAGGFATQQLLQQMIAAGAAAAAGGGGTGAGAGVGGPARSPMAAGGGGGSVFSGGGSGSGGPNMSVLATGAHVRDLEQQNHTMKLLLVESLAELQSRERDLGQATEELELANAKIQEMLAQRVLLYREHARLRSEVLADKKQTDARAERVESESQALKTELDAMRRLVVSLTGRPAPGGTGAPNTPLRGSSEAAATHGPVTEASLKRDLEDAVRSLAVTQVKLARLQRAATRAEKVEGELRRDREELEDELRELSAVSRARLEAVQRARSEALRRVRALSRELDQSAPRGLFRQVSDKLLQMETRYRRLLEEAAGEGSEGEVRAHKLVEELSDLTNRFYQATVTAGKAQERARQLEESLRALQLSAGTSITPDLKGYFERDLITRTGEKARLEAQLSLMERDKSRQEEAIKDSMDRLRLVEDALLLNQDKLTDAERSRTDLQSEVDRLITAMADIQGAPRGPTGQPIIIAAAGRGAGSVSASLSMDASGAGGAGGAGGYGFQFKGGAAQAEMERVLLDYDAKVSELSAKLAQAEAEAERRHAGETEARADVLYLREALKDMAKRSDGSLDVALLHEEVLAARGKEALARSAMARNERDRDQLRDQVLKLEERLRERDRESERTLGLLRGAERVGLDLRLQLERVKKGHVEAWKAERWQRQLSQVRRRHEWLLDLSEDLCKGVLGMEERAAAAELRLESLVTTQQMIHGNASAQELTRELIKLKDTLVKARTAERRLERERSVLQEKIHFLERVQSELESTLSKYESESLAVQSVLEHERDAATSRANNLESELQRLGQDVRTAKEESDALRAALADVQGEEGMGRRAKRALNAAGYRPGGGGGGGAAGDGFLTDDDRAFLLDQVQKHRATRIECDELRSKAGDLGRQLEDREIELLRVQAERDQARAERDLFRATRMADEGGYELAREQYMRPVESAQSAVRQVQEAAQVEITRLEKLSASLQAEVDQLREEKIALRGEMSEEARRAHERIARLEKELAEVEGKRVATYMDAMDALTKAKEARDPQAKQMQSEAIARLIEELQAKCASLEAQAASDRANLDRQLADARVDFERQVELKSRESDELRAQITSLKKQLSEAKGEFLNRAAHQQLKSELAKKDGLCRRLKEAIKQLEIKLKDLLVSQADDTMKESSWVTQQKQDRRIQELQDRVAAADRHVESMLRERSGLEARLDDKIKENAALRRDIHDLKARLEQSAAEASLTRSEASHLKQGVRGSDGLRGSVGGAAGSLQAQVLEKKLKVQQERCRAMELEIKELQHKCDQIEAKNRRLERQATAGAPPPSGARPSPSPATTPMAKGKPPGAEAEPASPVPSAAALGDTSVSGGPIPAEGTTPRPMTSGSDMPSDKENTLGASQPMPPLPGSSAKSDVLSRWEEGKKLQGRIDLLKRRLQDKSKEVEAGEAERKDLRERVMSLSQANTKLAVKLQQVEAQLSLTGEASASSAAAATPTTRRVPAPSRSPPAPSSSQKEKEIQGVVDTLRKALERTQSDLKESVPGVKYAALGKRKEELEKRVLELEAQLGHAAAARAQLEELEGRHRELTAVNAALRRHLKSTTDAAEGQAGAADRLAEAERNMAALRAQVREGEVLASALRQAAEDKDREMERIMRGAGAGAGAGAAQRPPAAEDPGLSQRVATLERENEALRRELEAFTPEFFEEIEDLKYEYHSLKDQHARLVRQCQEYERLLRVNR